MRLQKQNKRSCLGLLAAVAVLAGIVLWMSLGGMPRETLADDPVGPIDAVPPPTGPATPGSGPPPPARKPG